MCSAAEERNIHSHQHAHTDTDTEHPAEAGCNYLPNHPQECVPGKNTMQKMKASCRHTKPAEVLVIRRIHKGESQVLDNRDCMLFISALPFKVLTDLQSCEAGSGHQRGALYFASTAQAARPTSSLASRNIM